MFLSICLAFVVLVFDQNFNIEIYCDFLTTERYVQKAVWNLHFANS